VDQCVGAAFIASIFVFEIFMIKLILQHFFCFRSVFLRQGNNLQSQSSETGRFGIAVHHDKQAPAPKTLDSVANSFTFTVIACELYVRFKSIEQSNILCREK